MSRFISCLRSGLVRGTKIGDRAPQLFDAFANSNGHIITMQAARSLSTVNTTIRRNLYTENALGISKLDRLRAKKEQMFMGTGAKERYVERLNGYIQSGDTQSIFKDDLVNLIGIASNEKDLDLLETIVSRADEQQSDFFSGWGTSVMRLYYKMNKVDRALQNIKDIEKFRQFFNLRSCYKVLMCMLYDAQRYSDVLDVFEFSQQHLKKETQEQGEDETSSDRDLSLVALAAMAKINTEQELHKAEALLLKIRQTSKNVGLRPTSFVAYMAVSNNQPKLALNLISNVPNRTYITLRELKIVSLIQLGRFEDILLLLREYVASLKRETNLMLQSTYDKITANKNEIQEPSMRQELEDMLAEIREGGHVSTATIEELLFKPIEFERATLRTDPRMGSGGFRQPGGYQGNNLSNNYNNNYSNNYNSGSNTNNRYSPRGPRNQYGNNQYGNNQYGNRDRVPRRNNFEQDDEGVESGGSQGREERQPRRFNYQNMNLD